MSELTQKGNTVIVQDIGNLTHGCSTFKKSNSSLSSLIEVDNSDIHDMLQYDDFDQHLYEVNGKYYLYGEVAAQKGLIDIQGNARYAEGIYDVKAAIGMFNTIEQTKADVIYLGSFPPKDKAYKDHLKSIMNGKRFTIKHMGITKAFKVKNSYFTKESKAAFYHALMSWDGIHFQGDNLIKNGTCLTIDVGGFTSDLEAFHKGISMNNMEASESKGIIHIIQKLQDKMRKKYWKELQGIDIITHDDWIAAIEKGKLQIGVFDPLPCADIVKDLVTEHINYLVRMSNNFRGFKRFDCLLIVNGGGKVIEKQFRDMIDHPHIYVGEQDRSNMHLCTTFGLLKQARALEAKGEI